MQFVTMRGQTYQLNHLVKYEVHRGEREVGVAGDPTRPEPVFESFHYAVLTFSDGHSFELDGPQTEAFFAMIGESGRVLDLDAVERRTLGQVLVYDSEGGGEIVMPEPPPEADAPAGLGIAPGLFHTAD